MKINPNHVFKTLSGGPIKGTNEKEPFRLKDAAINVLTVLNDREVVEPKEKYRRAELAERIYRADGEIDLSIDDLKLLKDLIGEKGSPLIVKQAWDILDPKTKN